MDILIKMELILLEAVLNLGSPGDLVSVKKGYARNFLIPQGKAIPANDQSKIEFEAKKELIEKSELGRLNEAKELALQISEVQLEIKVPVSDEQTMYGSIGTREIADNFSKIDITVDIKSIRLPEGTLKELGSYSIDIELHPEIIQSVNINITPEV